MSKFLISVLYKCKKRLGSKIGLLKHEQTSIYCYLVLDGDPTTGNRQGESMIKWAPKIRNRKSQAKVKVKPSHQKVQTVPVS